MAISIRYILPLYRGDSLGRHFVAATLWRRRQPWWIRAVTMGVTCINGRDIYEQWETMRNSRENTWENMVQYPINVV